MEMKYCTKCGSKIPGDSVFCPACGEKIEVISENFAEADSRAGQTAGMSGEASDKSQSNNEKAKSFHINSADIKKALTRIFQRDGHWDRYKIGCIVSLLSLILLILAISTGIDLPKLSDALLVMVVIVSLVSYALVGLDKALKVIGRIMFFGWLIVPFPVDLLTGVIGFGVGLGIVLFVPSIPVVMTYIEICRARNGY